ncbi:MAG: cardiolipin synthase [Kiritimatiellae bacterium]|nr:cardiolipin synthase [Kiritimatiellia bacterium]
MSACAWPLGATPFDWASLGLGTAAHVVAAVLVTLHSLRSPREPRSTLLWIYLAWAMPILGVVIYLAFGINRMPVKGWQKQRSDQSFLAARREAEDESHPLAYWRGLQRALLTHPANAGDAEVNLVLDRLVPQHPLLGGNRIETYTDGTEAYPAMLAAIREARHHIHLQSYIIGNDAVGRTFLDLLAARAREGVRVRLLYDDFGSAHSRLGGLFFAYRRVPNMHVVGFTQVNPIKRQFQLNLRNHRKIMVVDGRHGFIGGMNLSAAHQPDDPGRAAIRDYHFALHGPVALELQYTFLRDWYYMTDEDAGTLLSQEHFPRIEPQGTTPIRVVNAGPASEREVLCDAYFSLIAAAREQILLGTPYFVPPDDLRRALRAAALRGVEVRLLLPARTNHLTTTYAARAVYEEMLTAGVRLDLRRPPFMHSKFMLVDDRIAMLGTANFDNRSLKLNYETNLLVFDPDFVSTFKRLVLDDYALADRLELDVWLKRSHAMRLVENFFNLISPAL